ncbi:MAG: divergent PAP2 family protein [Clostridiales bacterium]|nr:divergent PAP2 family protein [Clostridiales bacterium]
MTFWEELFQNEILVSSVIAWTIAQVLKTSIDSWLNRRFLAERLVGSGGMPSSHSSIVCGLTVSTALVYGIGTFEFSICFVLAAVVMYDAIGVRRETGKQSKLLNLILEQNLFELNEDQFHEKLKEFVGHTPLQVFAGAVLGIVTSLVVHGFY